MIELLTAVALWCAPMTNVQDCRDRILNCMATEKTNQAFTDKAKTIYCFTREKAK